MRLSNQGAATTTDDDGIKILHVYSKEISKRMLNTVKARSGESAAPTLPPMNEATTKVEEEEDARSSFNVPRMRRVSSSFKVSKLPDTDPLLQRNAVKASSVMNRPPISELVG